MTVGDHDTSYAPSPAIPMVHTMGPRVAQAAMLRLVDALNASGNRPVMVLGAPMRILMPADRNPFPRFRPFRWLP